MRKYLVRRLMIGLCAAFALFALWYNFNSSRLAAATHRQLIHEEQLTEQDGIPLNRASLIDVKPAASEDAGPIYEQLRTIWKGRDSDDDTNAVAALCQNHLPSPSELSKARKALARQARALTLVHQAASRPHCVLQIHWTMPNPSEIPYPQLAIIRNSARYLEAESILLASDGRYLDAVRNAALGFKVADQAETGKSSIAYLVSAACDAITLGAMRKILYLHGDKPGVAALMSTEVAQNFHAPSAAASLRTEAVMNIGLVEYLRSRGWRALYDMSGDDPSLYERLSSMVFLTGHTWDFQLNSNGVAILQQMRQAISVADHPFYQSRATLATLKTALDKKSMLFGIAKIVLPQFENLTGKRAQVQNDAQMVMLASQIIDQHISGSAYPLSVHTAIDMYTGKPLCYRREGAGFIIYTPGLEGTFDGGTLTKRPKIAEYVFHYPMPPYYLTPEPKSP